ncbi:MAG: VCBS repeat-containing protein [Lewinella sp.]|uniref:VCBS repeat-containing protein n=1 Tax=Lewinella sp. TaxID=2004506 RepID=UPI003D6BE135
MKRPLKSLFFIGLLALLTVSCGDAGKNASVVQKDGSVEGLFELKSVAECGIDFANTITEDEVYNHILIDVIVNGGGVAVVDINNDDLLDIFFAGNMVEDKLYLNKGDLKFEDISASAGVVDDSWSSAVAIADVNNDGFQDIYVGKFVRQEPGKLKNKLYINNGDLTFTESAAQYGLDHDGHCTAANFFDYDMDGDLDLYLGIEPFVLRHTKYNPDYEYTPSDYTDRLFRNNGNGSFTDVTKAAGMENFNFTLAATVSDVNHDGYPDMYVASDYEEPDYYYVNNRNGTFTNQIHTGMRHISNFSMGVDIADMNNDGWPDIVVADMAPEDNYRSKANMSGMNPTKFWGLAQSGYHYQYMFNTLQLNNGNGTYSEIGNLANIAQTDWSWATLLGDYDLDGDKDLYITNGQLRDIRNKDYIKMANHAIDSLSKLLKPGELINALPLVDYAPQEKLMNYMFVNNNDLGFTNETELLGLPERTFSQGAVYADLDNDGDLDLLVNNMNDRAFLYENHATEKLNHHYLSLKLKGELATNPLAYGAKAWVFTGEKLQMQEVAPVRGYMSSNDPVLSFGLGKNEKIDRLVIQWPGGKVTELLDVAVDQRLTLSQADGEVKAANIYHINPPIFQDVTAASQLAYAHRENDFDDYDKEVLIPHRMSHLGPAAAKADVNGDGLEDMYLGGAAGQTGTLFLQQANETLIAAPSQPWQQDAASEDVNAHFFDADGDGDQDLYVISGGNDFAEGSAALADRLYINQGNGQFAKSNKLPVMKISGGVAVSGDVDNDGDLDLFIGGRQVPEKYGYPAESYLLRNDNGQFVDATKEVFPDNSKLGMVSDAIWLDVDEDQDLDLIVVGEWMPITIFKNEGGKLSDQTVTSELENTRGWWNRIVAADLDGDGDQDLVVGNVGKNIKFKASKDKPFKAYINDFDENGTNDVYLAYYDRNGKELPVRGRQCSSEQMDFVLEEFPTYHDFAQASVEDVLAGRMDGAVSLEAYEFSSVILRNNGNGGFSIEKLPAIAQSFPVFGIVARDWNADGIMDLVLAGNYYEREVETTRSDAGIGLTLIGQEDGSFKALPAYETGMYAYYDVRNLLQLENNNKPLLVIVNNNEGAQVYR